LRALIRARHAALHLLEDLARLDLARITLAQETVAHLAYLALSAEPGRLHPISDVPAVEPHGIHLSPAPAVNPFERAGNHRGETAEPAQPLAVLAKDYGHTWDISPGVSGGYIAVRHGGLSADAQIYGMSTVRCGATVNELRHCLEEETRCAQALQISLLERHTSG
jgi:hypothetical protein